MNDRASVTAVMVAKGIAAVYSAPEIKYLVPRDVGEATIEMLERESKASAQFVHMVQDRSTRGLAFAIQRVVSPGMFLHLALRKRFIEDAVRNAIKDGYQQVVVLGAGLDTLALRLHVEIPSACFLEVDHPASQQEKHRLLPAATRTEENLHFCPLNLLDLDLVDKLSACSGFAKDTPTMFVAEGLFMYLAEDSVRQLLKALKEVSPRVRVVFTSLEVGQDGEPRFRRSNRLMRRWLEMRKEPFKWGILPGNVPAFLSPQGFQLVSTAGAAKMKHEYLATNQQNLYVAEGEWIYICESN